jgi:hypothetical protein
VYLINDKWRDRRGIAGAQPKTAGTDDEPPASSVERMADV